MKGMSLPAPPNLLMIMKSSDFGSSKDRSMIWPVTLLYSALCALFVTPILHHDGRGRFAKRLRPQQRSVAGSHHLGQSALQAV